MINQVYHIVQAILDKNGYGPMAPARFVYLATQEQLSIVNDVIDVVQRESSKGAILRPSEYIEQAEVAVDMLTETKMLSRLVDGNVADYHPLPDDYLHFIGASVDNESLIKIPSRKKSLYKRMDVGLKWCYIEGKKLYVYPSTVGVIMAEGVAHPYSEVALTYIRSPKDPNWTYETVNGNPIFNPSSPMYQDFEIPYYFMPRLVAGILGYAGVQIRASDVVNFAKNEEVEQYNKEQS